MSNASVIQVRKNRAVSQKTLYYTSSDRAQEPLIAKRMVRGYGARSMSVLTGWRHLRLSHLALGSAYLTALNSMVLALESAYLTALNPMASPSAVPPPQLV